MVEQKVLLRALPKVDEFVTQLLSIEQDAPLDLIKNVVRSVINNERNAILADSDNCILRDKNQWLAQFSETIKQKMLPNLRRVINGSGVVVHTNLGRSVLPSQAMEMLLQAGGYYSNLEFDLATGKRGSRYSLVENLLCDLTGAEAAMVVNNNAAAVLLALDSLTSGFEVIVSRGQLVEIGGSFRIPDVMAKSGAILREVGATNRTHLHDYANAITDQTKMLLRVHTSNFKVIGFTSEVSAREMVALAGKNNLLVMEDLGSGSLLDLSKFGLPYEPTVQDVVKAGVDVVTFSGDKLLGGPQAGIILGKKSIIDAIKSNPLTRALRIDKFTLASLESILRCYYDEEKAVNQIPTLAMLTQAPDIIKARCNKLIRRVRRKLNNSSHLSLLSVDSRVGGGAMPEHGMQSWAVVLQHKTVSASSIEKSFRSLPVPVIGRIENEMFIIDMRTVSDNELSDLAEILITFIKQLNS